MNYKRDLDILICNHVFKEEVYFLAETHGYGKDLVSANKKSSANEPIYTLDMIEGYVLKHFSNSINNAFDLISFINKQGYSIKFEQVFKKWKGSLNSKNKEIIVSVCSDLPELLCLLALKSYGYDISQIKTFSFKLEEKNK